MSPETRAHLAGEVFRVRVTAALQDFYRAARRCAGPGCRAEGERRFLDLRFWFTSRPGEPGRIEVVRTCPRCAYQEVAHFGVDQDGRVHPEERTDLAA